MRRWTRQLPAAGFDRTPTAHAELVRTLLDDLDEAQAKALLMHIMLGHSLDEIATMTGVSVNTVKTRLRLAKDRLRRWMRRSGEGRRAGE
jgi:DNA-directed RNA polymerase specialized sigma24 family protein